MFEKNTVMLAHRAYKEKSRRETVAYKGPCSDLTFWGVNKYNRIYPYEYYGATLCKDRNYVFVKLENKNIMRISAIKTVREYTGWGLADAKSLVDSFNIPLPKCVEGRSMRDFIKALQNCGCVVGPVN